MYFFKFAVFYFSFLIVSISVLKSSVYSWMLSVFPNSVIFGLPFSFSVPYHLLSLFDNICPLLNIRNPSCPETSDYLFKKKKKENKNSGLLGLSFLPLCCGRAAFISFQHPRWKSLDESESGEWKSWLKTQHSENEDHGIQSHHFMGNRWGNSGNNVRLYFFGLQNHYRWWLQAWLKDAYSLEEKLWPT